MINSAFILSTLLAVYCFTHKTPLMIGVCSESHRHTAQSYRYTGSACSRLKLLFLHYQFFFWKINKYFITQFVLSTFFFILSLSQSHQEFQTSRVLNTVNEKWYSKMWIFNQSTYSVWFCNEQIIFAFFSFKCINPDTHLMYCNQSN